MGYFRALQSALCNHQSKHLKIAKSSQKDFFAHAFTLYNEKNRMFLKVNEMKLLVKSSKLHASKTTQNFYYYKSL